MVTYIHVPTYLSVHCSIQCSIVVVGFMGNCLTGDLGKCSTDMHKQHFDSK